jgi:hypothetical protein
MLRIAIVGGDRFGQASLDAHQRCSSWSETAITAP